MTPQSRLHLNTHDLAGGAAKVAWRLAEAQRASGHSVRLLVSIKQSTEDYSTAFAPRPDPNLQAECRARGQLYYEYQGSHGLAEHPLVRSADLLHLHNLHGEYFNPFSLLLLSRFRPLVWTLHDLQAITGHCAHSYACDRWRSGCGACPDLLQYPELQADTTAQLFRDKQALYAHSWFQPVAPSRWLQAKAEQGIFGDRPVELIYNGVDTEVFQPYDPAALRQQMGIAPDLLLVGCVSNGGVIANHYKGGDYTLAAMQALRRQVPNAVFVNIGAEGESPAPYVINIPPIRDETELARLLATFDIFLFTSLAENCPLSVLEALACGVPVVTFATGGTPELVVHEQCGLVAEYKNGNALAAHLIQLGRNASMRRRFGIQARKRAVEQFDHRRIVAQYEALYTRSCEAWQRWRTSGQSGAIPVEKLPSVIRTPTFLTAVARLESGAKQASGLPISDPFAASALNWPNGQPSTESTPVGAVANPPSAALIDATIVVATKDRAVLLEAMLASLSAAAAGITCEIVAVVGDCSDATLDVLGRYGPVRLFLEREHLGPGRHSWPQLYNFGFAQARGTWAMYASDDIVFDVDCLRKAVALLQAQPTDVAGGIFFYRNQIAEPGWGEFGIDYTYGQKLLMNYGLFRLAAFRGVGGLDEQRYRFYCADGDLCYKLYETGWRLLPLPGCFVTHNNTLDVQKQTNLEQAQADIRAYLGRWKHFVSTTEPNPRRLLWREFDATNWNISARCSSARGDGIEVWQEMRRRGLWQEGQPLRLHLGCGEQHFDGYVNIDHPPAKHTVQSSVAADIFADIVQLELPAGSVDEVRLHHLFEHFNRPTALALLCRWQCWLKRGGRLVIETPDAEASASLIAEPQHSFAQKQVVLRHLFGSHEADWACHYDGWYPAKYERVLGALGFGEIQCQRGEWLMTRNVTATAVKVAERSLPELASAVSEILRESLVDASASETRLHGIWMGEFTHRLGAAVQSRGAAREGPPSASAPLASSPTHAPVVSIFIPAYNREQYLSATLDSLLAQTFGDFEIIVADDGSTDRTLAIARDYAVRDSRIRVLALPHRGEVVTRNEAVRAAHQGSCFLTNHDSDDIALPDKLLRLVAYLEEHPSIGVVGCFAEYFDDSGKTLGRPPLEHEPARIRATFGEFNSMVNSAALIRRAVFAKVGLYREPFRSVDDYDFFARALLAGFDLANVPDVLHCIRLHPTSVGSTRARQQQELAAVIRAAYQAGKVAERVAPPEARRQKRTDGSTSLNILHTVEFYAPHTGGAEAVVQQISERLMQRGHRVTVATTKLPERSFRELNGVAIAEFAVAGKLAEGIRGEFGRYQEFLRGFDCDVMMNYAAQQWATDLAMPLLPQLRERHANVIAPCGYSALADARTLRWPQFHDYFHKLLPEALPIYNAAVYHSAAYKDFEFGQLLGLKNGLIIPNGTDTDEFTRPPTVNFREKYGIATKFVGLCVANFYPDKGQERIIECVRQMQRPDFTMVFIGKEGAQLEALQQRAKGLNVRFLVAIPREDTVAAFRSSDLFLFASHIEASPLVIIEAKAARLPFISTDCGNVREWKGGLVCAPEEIAAQATRLLDDEAKRRELAEEGWREWKDRLTWEAVVDQWEDLYLKLHAAKVETTRTVSSRPAIPSTLAVGVVFSKDRPLQLDGTLRSFFARCQDANQCQLKVLYLASADCQPLYDRLVRDYPAVEFVAEKNFRNDLLTLLSSSEHVLFVVDDNLFIRNFTLAEVVEGLRQCPAAVGFSLRLGRNTTVCYPLKKTQALPAFVPVGLQILRYDWTKADGDFNYPLEVSSSVYRTADLMPLLQEIPFKNPNTLEGELAARVSGLVSRPQLLCFEQSRAFCNPVNVVQRICQNRAGELAEHSPERLAQQFRAGLRLDVEAYRNFTPTGCHQEVPLHFDSATLTAGPAVSIVIPCYKQAHYLPEAVQSVVAQTFADWEVIVVSDGSPDDTVAVAGRLAREHPSRRIRLHTQSNQGLAMARNNGIAKALGKYILPLDADDALAPEFLAKSVAILEAHADTHIVYTDQLHFGDRQGICQTSELTLAKLATHNLFAYCSLYRREVFDAVGGYNPNMVWGYEDWDFWIGATERGFKARKVAEPLFHYRVKADSMLATAEAHAAALRARIVLNHPKVYDDRSRRWAAEVWAGVAAAAEAARPAAFADPAPVGKSNDALAESGNPGFGVLAPSSGSGANQIWSTHSVAASAASRAAAGLVASSSPVFDIVAIVAAYNEGDVIYHVLRDLIENGIKVYFIDNASTDNTREEVSRLLGRGVIKLECFPKDAGYPIRSEQQYVWRDLLRRKAEVASELNAAWYIHADADEFRESPWPGLSLAEAIQRVDALGYNALSFELLNFRPVDDAFVPGSDVREHLRYCEGAEFFNHLQIKAWKNTGQPVDLASSGGHEAKFAGRRVCPLPFLHRHYPIRGETHGRQKVLRERLPRFTAEERAAGWHVQYDCYATGEAQFLKRPAELELYDPVAVRVRLMSRALRDPLLASAFSQVLALHTPIQSPEVTDWIQKAAASEAPASGARLDEEEAARSLALKALDADGFCMALKHYQVEQSRNFAQLDLVNIKPIETTAALFQHAESLRQAAKWKEAGEVYQILTNRLPDDLAAWRGRLECARQQGHAVLAKLLLEDALERHPEWAEALNGTASGLRVNKVPHGSPASSASLLQAAAVVQAPSGHDSGVLRSGAPRVSIIIPVFNKFSFTRKCLKALKRHTPAELYEVIIWDNGSTDETQAFLQQESEKNKAIRYFRSEDNLGFAAGCNLGARTAQGRYVLFLNNDTEVQPGWLDPLVDRLEADSRLGAVGSKLLFPDGTIQHAGVVIIEDRQLPDPLVARHIHYRKPNDATEANEPRLYQALTAACLLVRKSAFDQVGGFDEGYWNGYEDVDLCFKLQQAGLSLLYEPRSVVVHFESQSGPERFRSVGSNIERLHARWLDKVKTDYIVASDGSISRTAAEMIRSYAESAVPAKPQVPEAPIASIILLAHNQLAHTERCLASLERHTHLPYEVILVDNGSTDGTVEFFREFAGRHDNVRVIANRTNRGFAAGNNQGLAIARGETVVLLNNDTVVTAGWLNGMLGLLQREPQTSVVGPMSNCVSGPQLVSDVGYADLSGLSAFAAQWAARNAGQSVEFGRVVGFCLLARRDLIARIGGLDESFGSGNFEDDDFCIRARLAGSRIRIAQDVFIHHTGSQTFKGAKIDYRQAMLRNWDLFRAKWQFPPEVVLERGYPFPQQLPPGVPLKVPLPGLNLTHEPTVDGRWWDEKRALVKSGKAKPITLPPCALLGHLGEARQFFNNKKLPAAWGAVRAVLKHRPFHPEAYLLMAEIALAAHDAVSARACAQYARQIAPEFKPAKKFLKASLHGNLKPEWLVLPDVIRDPHATRRPHLSVCLIVKNEERFIGQCLASVEGLADQIVVVDTGSTDRTVEIAKHYKAEVHSFTWCDDFSAARNAALEHVTGDWVLALDADEELPPEQHEALRKLLRAAPVISWRLPIQDVGREAEGCSYVPRLFRNAPAIFYVGRVHEQVFTSLEVRREEWGMETRMGDATLRHHGYTKELTQERDKVGRNLRLLEKAVSETPGEANLLMNYGLELTRSGRPEEGLLQYRAAFEAMADEPPALVVPESREMLLGQFCTQLMATKGHAEIVRVLTSPLAKLGVGLTASLHFTLGLAQMELKEFVLAAEQFRQCLAKRDRPALTPVNVEIRKAGPHHCLALCLAQSGDKAAAEREFQAARQDDPESVPVVADYGRFLQEQGKAVAGLQLLHQFTSEHPQAAVAWQAGGTIALSQPEFLEVAVDWTAEALRHFPEDTGIQSQRAEALLLAGLPDEARLLWRQLAKGGKPSPLGALILCETAVGKNECAPPPELAAAVTQEFVHWYRRLLEFGAEPTVRRVNAGVDGLARLLPRAAELLRAVITEANVPTA